MISYTTSGFWKAYAGLEASVKEQAQESYRLFEQNPYHPSLHFKKIHRSKPIFSARVNIDFRAVGVKDGNEIVWFWIGPHAEYERVIA